MNATQETSQSARTYGPLELARQKARKALEHLNNCREHVKAMEKRVQEAQGYSKNWNLLHWRCQLTPICTALALTAIVAERKAHDSYVEAHSALYDAQLEAGLSDAQIDRMRDLLGDDAREG